MRTNRCALLLLLTTLWVPMTSQAAALNSVQLFRRCYAQMTGQALKPTDSRIALIKAGSLDPITACTNLLAKGEINSADSQGRLVSPTDTEGLLVLRRFYKIYTGFIQTLSGSENIAQFFEDLSSTEDLYDNTVVGLAMTENALNPQKDFKDLFAISRSPMAVREIDTSVTYPFTMGFIYGGSVPGAATQVFSPRARHGLQFTSVDGTTKINPDTAPFSLQVSGSQDAGTAVFVNLSFSPVQVGELVGINYNSPVQIVAAPGRTNYAGIPYGFDMNSTIYNGIPFLRPYALANANLPLNNQIRPNLEQMPRRYSQSIIRDFLCRDLPVVRDGDITSYVSTDPNGLAFRKANSCVRCHATIDQLAATYRGLGYIGAGDRRVTSLNRFAIFPHVSAPVAGFAAETNWPDLKDVDYYKRPAVGRFYFRSLSGELINQPLSSGSDFSATLANLDDAYICQAKKMFRYLTGIDVALFDAYDPAQTDRMQSMSTKDWLYRNEVTRLGRNLKKHQKMQLLIEEILKSKFYQQSDLGVDE
jgi:hypothetical protein